MSSPRRPPSREFAVVHPDGSITDAEMHAEMLDDEDADLVTRRYTARRLLAEGGNRAALARLYDLPEDFDLE